MRTSRMIEVGAAMAAILMVTVRAGAHSFPASAPTLKSSLVQNYPPCTAPGTTNSNGEAACVGAAEVDPSCVFTSKKGAGTLSVNVKKTNLTVVAKLRGLGPECEGKSLTAALGIRTTSDSCPDDHCTSVDREITAGTCTVRNGRCAISTSIAPGYEAGSGAEMTVLTCGVKNGSLLTFTCGVMVK